MQLSKKEKELNRTDAPNNQDSFIIINIFYLFSKKVNQAHRINSTAFPSQKGLLSAGLISELRWHI